MKIAVIDTHTSGHHFIYTAHFCKILLELGHEVHAFYPDTKSLSTWISAQCPQQKTSFNAVEQKDITFTATRFKSHISLIKPIFKWLRLLRSLKHENIQPDLLFFAYLDSFTFLKFGNSLIDLICPFNWSGLYIMASQRRLPLEFRPLHGRDETFRSKRCKFVAVLDEGIPEDLAAECEIPVIRFPDFADAAQPELDFIPLQDIKDKAKQRRVVGIVGTLGARKGVVTLLKASEQLADSNLFFVFAGPLFKQTFTADETQYITRLEKKSPENCYFYFNPIDNESEFNALIYACDVIFLGYTDFFGSSNLLTKAAIFNKIVLASKEFCIGERVARYRMGEVFQAGNLDQCISKLSLLAEKDYYQKVWSNALFEQFEQDHNLKDLPLIFDNLLSRIEPTIQNGQRFALSKNIKKYFGL